MLLYLYSPKPGRLLRLRLPSFGPASLNLGYSQVAHIAGLEVDPTHSALMVWQLPTFAYVQSITRGLVPPPGLEPGTSANLAASLRYKLRVLPLNYRGIK